MAACLMLDTGLRLQELLVLTVAAVDFDNLIVKVAGKGTKQRLVPISTHMRRMLYRYSGKIHGPLLFGTRNFAYKDVIDPEDERVGTVLAHAVQGGVALRSWLTMRPRPSALRDDRGKPVAYANG